MAVQTTLVNKPLNPRGNDQSPLAFNRAKLFSGKALDFDGVNDHIVDQTINVNSTSFSVSFYAKYSDHSTANSCAFSIGPSGFGTGYDLVVYPFDGSLKTFRIYSRYNDDNILSDSSIPITGVFNHYVVQSDGTNLSVYANGVLAASVAYDNDRTFTRFQIGKLITGTQYYVGQLSNFKLFNTALTAAQVADLYNNPEKVVPTGVDNTALKLWLPMQEGAGTTAYDGSPSGFVEDIVTGFTNGTTYPLDSFASSGDDITTAIKTNGFGGCVSNGHYYTNGQKVKVKFTYQKNSGDDLRVLFSSVVTGAGTAKSDTQNVSASGEFEYTFTMTDDGIAYLQLGTGNASHSIDAVITDVYVSPNVSANHGTISGATYVHGIGAPVAQTAVIDWNKLYDFDGTDDQAYNISYDDVTGTKTYKVHFNSHDVTQQDQQIVQFFNNTAKDGFGVTIAPFGGNSSKLGFRVVFNEITGTQLSWEVESNTFYELVFTIDWDAESISNVTLNGESATGTLAARVANPSFGLYLGARSTAMYLKGIINYFEVVGEEKWTNASGFKSESGSYDMTIDGSPTQILAPQGLTTGRDLLGNLFENVRKQGALNLDGNSWAEVHDNASFDFGTGSFSLEAWVKIENINTGAGINAVFGLGGNATAGNAAYIETNAFLNSVFRYDSGVSVGPVLTRGDWAHIVGVFDGTNTKIYSNGVLEDTDAATAVDMTNSEVKLIGRDSAGTRYYKDQIAQPRIYNRALTAEEVARNYNNAKSIYTNS